MSGLDWILVACGVGLVVAGQPILGMMFILLAAVF